MRRPSVMLSSSSTTRIRVLPDFADIVGSVSSLVPIQTPGCGQWPVTFLEAPLFGERQDERKGAALTGRAVELDAAAVRADHVLHDGQPETRPFAFARKPVVDAIKLLEDALVLRGRN